MGGGGRHGTKALNTLFYPRFMSSGNSLYDTGVAIPYPCPVGAASKILSARSALALTFLAALMAPREAWAGLEDWELNEVHLQSQSDTGLRFVELVNASGGCLFPSSTLNLYSGDGALLDVMALAQATTCYGAPTYLLLATAEASIFFGVDSDVGVLAELPSSGQLCFVSSATHYDCVRWGSIASPIVDLFGSSDTSVVPAPANNFSLIRAQSTHVVNADWLSETPTPRAPNDGSPWSPPDAGPLPDASPSVDAGPLPDAGQRRDAGPPPDATPDARNTRYLDLDAVGGDCSCQHGGGKGTMVSFLILLGIFARLRRRQS